MMWWQIWVTLAFVGVLLLIAFMLNESSATACEEAGGTVLRNALGEYRECLPSGNN